MQKHSGAAHAEVKLEMLDGKLHLSISDDGAGFDVKDGATVKGWACAACGSEPGW